MTQAEEKFLETTQEPLKLQIALQRFFELTDEEAQQASWKERYGAYLKRRLRPAMEHLICQGETEKISALLSFGWMRERDCLDFIAVARERGQLEILSLLLHVKEEQFAFHDKEFLL